MENIKGSISDFININPWTQFYDLQGRKDIPLSYVNNVTLKNCECRCNKYFNVKKDTSQYLLSDFVFENLKIDAKIDGFSEDTIENIKVNNVNIRLSDTDE